MQDPQHYGRQTMSDPTIKPGWIPSSTHPDQEVWFDGQRETTLTRRIDSVIDVAAGLEPQQPVLRPMPPPTATGPAQPAYDQAQGTSQPPPLLGAAGSIEAPPTDDPGRKKGLMVILALAAVLLVIIGVAGALLLAGGEDIGRTTAAIGADESQAANRSGSDGGDSAGSEDVSKSDVQVATTARKTPSTTARNASGASAGNTSAPKDGKTATTKGATVKTLPPTTAVVVLTTAPVQLQTLPPTTLGAGSQPWAAPIAAFVAADNRGDALGVADQYSFPLPYIDGDLYTREELIADLYDGWSTQSSHTLAMSSPITVQSGPTPVAGGQEVTVGYRFTTRWVSSDPASDTPSGCLELSAVDRVRYGTGATITSHLTEVVGPC